MRCRNLCGVHQNNMAQKKKLWKNTFLSCFLLKLVQNDKVFYIIQNLCPYMTLSLIFSLRITYLYITVSLNVSLHTEYNVQTWLCLLTSPYIQNTMSLHYCISNLFLTYRIQCPYITVSLIFSLHTEYNVPTLLYL